jgi:hypothetical protein
MYSAQDLDRYDRIANLRVDMGCFEYRPPRGCVILLR